MTSDHTTGEEQSQFPAYSPWARGLPRATPEATPPALDMLYQPSNRVRKPRWRRIRPTEVAPSQPIGGYPTDPMYHPWNLTMAGIWECLVASGDYTPRELGQLYHLYH